MIYGVAGSEVVNPFHLTTGRPFKPASPHHESPAKGHPPMQVRPPNYLISIFCRWMGRQNDKKGESL